MEFTYEEFINHIIQTRGRFACGDEYHETHHIIPKCMNGTDDKDNLIDLFAREHFEAHRLLALENPENKKLIHAWWLMSTTLNANKRRVKITPEEYEEAKKIVSKTMSGENNPMYGKPSPRRCVHLSEEQKQHLRDINTGNLNPKYGTHLSEETKEKIRSAHMGQTVTDEAKKNMRIAHIGKNMGVNHSRAKRVAQYGLDGVLIKIWYCISDVARELHISPSAIWNACNGENPTAGGYQFRYVNESVLDNIPPYINQSGKYQIKRIARCDEDWNIIDTWNGCTDAQNGTGISRSHISSCCNGKRQHAGGYRWKILNENQE